MSKNFYENYWKEVNNSIPTNDPTTLDRLKLLFNTLDKMPQDSKILDAGCGDGYFTNCLTEKGYSAIGMDVSHNAIKTAREKHRDIDFICNPIDEKWPFENDSFDAIFSTEVIEHVFGIYEMFAEMNRSTRKGGIIILTTPYHGLIKNLLIVLFGFDNHFNNIEGGHIRFFTKNFLRKTLLHSGFSIIETKYIGRFRPVSKSIYVVAEKVRNLDHDL